MSTLEESTLLKEVALQEAAKVGRIRLLDSASGVRLFFSHTAEEPGRGRYQTTVSSVAFPVPDGAARNFSVRQLLPGAPFWDVAKSADGAPVLVIGEFGGATHDLAMFDSRGARTLLSGHYKYRDFTDARLVKGPFSAPGAITAPLDGEQLLLLQPTPAGSYAEGRPLVAGFEHGLLLSTPSAHALLHVRGISGPVRGVITGPGSLHCTLFDRELRPAGPATKPFGDTTIFEFDADVTGKGVAVVATSAKGFILAYGISADPKAGLVLSASTEVLNKTELMHPALAVSGSAIHLAFLEFPGKPDARILAASVPLDVLLKSGTVRK